MRNITSSGLACLAVAIGLLLGHFNLSSYIENKLQEGILEQVVWRPDSPQTVQDRFIGSDADPPDYVRFYLLNVTNVAEVRSGGKPILQELGPYTFNKFHRKLNVTFSPDNTSVSFNEFFSFIPIPELTNGSLNDEVTTLNIPLVGAIEAILDRAPARFAPWVQYLARLVDGWQDPRVQGLFTTRPVGELLFGYEDPLLARLAKFLPALKINPTVALVPNMTAEQWTDPDPTQRDTVLTGADSLANVCEFKTWHGLSQIDSWRPPHIEAVQGTDATQFRPGLRRGDELQVWVGDVFRYFTLIEGFGPGAENPKVGFVPVLRFRPDPTQREPDPRYYQSIPGLMNITAPMAAAMGGVGPPLFLSLPGYCYADESLSEGVEGITCDHIKHDIHLDVEPTTGITLSALKTLMLNSWFGQRYKAVDPHVVDTFLPIFWAHESSEASHKQLSGFRSLLRAQAAKRFFDHSAPPLATAGFMIGAGLLLGAFLTARGPQPWEHVIESDEEAGPITVWPGNGAAGATAAVPALSDEEDAPLLREIVEDRGRNDKEEEEEGVGDGSAAGVTRITDNEEVLAGAGEGTA